MTSGNTGGDPKVLLLIPTAILAASSTWIGWTEIGLRSGMGSVAAALPVSVIGFATYTGLLQHNQRTRRVQMVRWSWFGAMALATAGAGLGAALGGGTPADVPSVVAALVRVVPVALLALTAHLVWVTRKESDTDA